MGHTPKGRKFRRGGMTTFRNGYHFVPRQPNDAKAKGRSLPINPREFGLRPGHESEGHAIYAEGANSGRITCRVTLECPTIIGGARKKGVDGVAPALVAPCLFDGRPAIPASSMKGLLSLVAESASRAPYRVLRDMQLTVAYAKRDNTAGGKLLSVRHQALDGKSSVNRVHLSTPTQIKSSRAYFDPSLHPLEIKEKSIPRALINPVESMFGFVAEAEKGQEKAGRGKVTAAAGKLRLSHALPSDEWTGKAVGEFFLRGNVDHHFDKVPNGVSLTLLKEQGEPMKKPKRQNDHGDNPAGYDKLSSATPNFYFYDKQAPDKFISKEEFATNSPAKYAAQGAKFYLHAPGTQTSAPWKSAGPKPNADGIDRKAAAPVMKSGITFNFHIDFDNLTEHELNILCFALRPSQRFRHKIGLGRGLGLGSIRIDVTGLVLINRKARYTAQALFDDDPRSSVPPTGASLAADCAKQHSDWLDMNDKGARTALLAIGELHDFDGANPAMQPVLWVPLTEARYQDFCAEQAGAEDKSFEWFTINDQSRAQKLRPIREGGVPTLETNARPPRNATSSTGGVGGAGQKPTVPAAAAQGGNGLRTDIGGQSNRAEGSRSGRLQWVTKKSTGAEFGKVVDDATGQQFHVKISLLRQAGLSAQDSGSKVTFTPVGRPPDSGKLPAILRISRA